MTRNKPSSLATLVSNRYAIVAGWIGWVTLAFFGASFVVVSLLYFMNRYQLIDMNNLSTAASFWIDAMLYMAMFFIVMWLPWYRWRNRAPKSDRQTTWQFICQSVGLTRLVKMIDLRYFFAGLPVFYGLVLSLSLVASMLLSNEVMNQTQEIGFAATQNGVELVIIFVALVIIAPLFEEMIMRGFLFGKLRQHIPMWPAAILVSLLFALAHGQINVGIMTFILSMFSCRMREKTGAIWAGLFLHMTVNLVAYSVRFLGLGS